MTNDMAQDEQHHAGKYKRMLHAHADAALIIIQQTLLRSSPQLGSYLWSTDSTERN